MSFQRDGEGRAFGPTGGAALSEALANAIRVLDVAPDQTATRELVAQLIVQAALEDDRLDAVGLCRKAVAAFRRSTAALSK
jgi:hypothetical protein